MMAFSAHKEKETLTLKKKNQCHKAAFEIHSNSLDGMKSQKSGQATRCPSK